jgi:hypothetical protein
MARNSKNKKIARKNKKLRDRKGGPARLDMRKGGRVALQRGGPRGGRAEEEALEQQIKTRPQKEKSKPAQTQTTAPLTTGPETVERPPMPTVKPPTIMEQTEGLKHTPPPYIDVNDPNPYAGGEPQPTVSGTAQEDDLVTIPLGDKEPPEKDIDIRTDSRPQDEYEESYPNGGGSDPKDEEDDLDDDDTNDETTEDETTEDETTEKTEDETTEETEDDKVEEESPIVYPAAPAFSTYEDRDWEKSKNLENSFGNTKEWRKLYRTSANGTLHKK